MLWIYEGNRKIHGGKGVFRLLGPFDDAQRRALGLGKAFQKPSLNQLLWALHTVEIKVKNVKHFVR